MYKLKIKIMKGECWWGGDVAFGGLTPIRRWTVTSFDTEHITTENQVSSLFVSNQGRFVWCENGFQVSAIFGVLRFRSRSCPLVYKEGYGTLKAAYIDAQKEFFPSSGKHPADGMFSKPQYCTWIALGEKPTESGVLAYAEGILKAGLPAGILIIDNGWQQNFGEWEFNSVHFAHPAQMLDKLNRMGFQVMLWVSPFVSAKSGDFTFLQNESMLLRNRHGEVSKCKRQKGSDALLDFSNPDTILWFRNKIQELKQKYPNIVGIKQDAGDPKYYFRDDISYGAVTPNGQAKLWAEFAESFAFNELRASVNFGGKAVMQRQMDKTHSWGRVWGLRSLIPCAMLQGVMGYPYTCADMIGGGQMKSFRGIFKGMIDSELMIRFAEVSALMPAMQFSYPAWQSGKKKVAEYMRSAAMLHMEFAPYILECVRNAAESGEPIVRIMEYNFPNDGLEGLKEQFMLGERYLVAPVVKRGDRKKEVSLPKGIWRHVNTGQVYHGEQDIEVKAPLGALPIFEKISDK